MICVSEMTDAVKSLIINLSKKDIIALLLKGK